MYKKYSKPLLLALLLVFSVSTRSIAATLLVPMDEKQANHLKAYGFTYWSISKGQTVDWLLNYRGGSFAVPSSPLFEKELLVRGVSYQILGDAQYLSIKEAIASPSVNQDIVKLEKQPRIAVYSPKTKQPWDDAVTMALTYADIPYEVIFDEEVLIGKLAQYDWLHLHHEDFTGQYGRFYASYSNSLWYQAEVRESETVAAKFGYAKVSQLKLAVVKRIRDFVAGGGYLFAMCSAPDTYDIALSADGLDICPAEFDGDPLDFTAPGKLNYDNTFAFTGYTLSLNAYEYEFSSIDVPGNRPVSEVEDYFTLFNFSAKTDPIPTMLCQNHMQVVKGFMGQTTAFKKRHIKPTVLVMGENKSLDEARYVHGIYNKGMFTFYGGHDPEDYQHFIGEPPTDLNLHPNSPGYRLILNNILFPAAKKQERID